MGLVRWAKKTIDRNRRSRKAISTIMANLTMLVIVVVLSSLLFVWAISSFGAYQGGAGYWFSSRSLANQERLSIEGAYIYVGTIPFTIASAYLNQTLYTFQLVQYNVSQVEPVGIPPSQVSNPSAYAGLCMTCVSQSFHSGSWTVTVATQRGTVVTTTVVY